MDRPRDQADPPPSSTPGQHRPPAIETPPVVKAPPPMSTPTSKTGPPPTRPPHTKHPRPSRTPGSLTHAQPPAVTHAVSHDWRMRTNQQRRTQRCSNTAEHTSTTTS